MKVEATQQQVNFINDFSAWSESAAGQLHTPPLFPLAQWAYESGWGAASSIANHNVAGLTVDKEGKIVAAYPSWAHMVTAYVNSMRDDCPNIYHGRTSATSTVAEILDGGIYNTVNQSYAKELQGVYDTVLAIVHPVPHAPAPVTPDEHVKEIQQDLNEVDNAGLTVDGIYGDKTKAAVIAFQRKTGLNPDGVYGALTDDAMQHALALKKQDEEKQPAPATPAPAPVQNPFGVKVGGLQGGLFGDALMVPLTANGQELSNMQFDTGDFELMFGAAAAARLHLPYLGTLQVTGVGGQVTMHTSQVDLQIGPTLYKNVPCIFDTAWTSSDGLFGLRFVVDNELKMFVDPEKGLVEFYK